MQNFRIPEDKKPALEEFKKYMEEKGWLKEGCSSLGVSNSLPDQVVFRYLYTSKFNKNSTRENTLQPMSDSKPIEKADCVEKRE